MQYKVPVTLTLSGFVTVLAESPEEAAEKVDYDSIDESFMASADFVDIEAEYPLRSETENLK